MCVQHVANAVGHKCSFTEKIVLYNKKCWKSTVSVNGGVLMCCVTLPLGQCRLALVQWASI